MFGLFGKKGKKENCLKAAVNGTVVPMSEASDETFASCMLGDGVVIHPSDGMVAAPCDGEITVFMGDSKHAVGLKTEYGFDLLIHIGIDTVSLAGEGFESFIRIGQKVKAGDKLIQFDKELIEAKGLCADVIMILLDSPELKPVKYCTGIEAAAGETVVAEF